MGQEDFSVGQVTCPNGQGSIIGQVIFTNKSKQTKDVTWAHTALAALVKHSLRAPWLKDKLKFKFIFFSSPVHADKNF